MADVNPSGVRRKVDIVPGQNRTETWKLPEIREPEEGVPNPGPKGRHFVAQVGAEAAKGREIDAGRRKVGTGRREVGAGQSGVFVGRVSGV